MYQLNQICMHGHRRFSRSWLVVMLILSLAAPAVAQEEVQETAGFSVEVDDDEDRDEAQEGEESSAPPPPGPPRTREEIIAHERAIQERHQIGDAIWRQLQTSNDTVPLEQLAQEIIDEIIADVADLNQNAFAPLALRQVELTSNLDPQFGEFVESSLVTGLATHTDVTIKRCVACNAMRSRVEGNDWVVTRGLVTHEELRAEAQRLGAQAFLDARFSYFPENNMVAMQVEFFRATDGAVLWSETYRSDATTAAILRTGDRVQTRQERVSELERKLEARPYYGYQLQGGFGHIPYSHPNLGYGGIMFGLRLYEKFGSELQYLYGIGAEAFANFDDDGLLGSFVYGLFQKELYEANLNQPTVRTGPAAGGFFAGNEGNSFFLGWTLDAIFQFRLGAGATVFYFRPVPFAGFQLGGFGASGRISLSW